MVWKCFVKNEIGLRMIINKSDSWRMSMEMNEVDEKVKKKKKIELGWNYDVIKYVDLTLTLVVSFHHRRLRGCVVGRETH